jgi:CrcB protein
MILSIAAGGAIGALGRHWISAGVQTLTSIHFPLGTLAVNVLGCLILGALVVLMALVWSPSQELRAFLTVGMMGALTTFSTFSVEVVLMMERGEWLHAGLYVVASVFLSIGAMMLAMAGMRWVLA